MDFSRHIIKYRWETYSLTTGAPYGKKVKKNDPAG